MSNQYIAKSRRLRSTIYSSRIENQGVTSYTIYNHMLLPAGFEGGLEETYEHLKNHVQVWDVAAERQIENSELSQWKNKISDIWFATKTNDYIFNQNYIVNGKNINNPKPEEIKDNLWFHLDYEEIVHRIVKASSFKLNWILDPFMNVGAVGVVAKKRGRRFIGFENNQDQILLAMNAKIKLLKLDMN